MRPSTRFQAPILNWIRSALNLENQEVATDLSNQPVVPTIDILADRYLPEVLHLSGIRTQYGSVQVTGAGAGSGDTVLFCDPTLQCAFIVMSVMPQLTNALAFKTCSVTLGTGIGVGASGVTSVTSASDGFMGAFDSGSRLRFLQPAGALTFGNQLTGVIPAAPFELIAPNAPVILAPNWIVDLTYQGMVAGDVGVTWFRWLEVPLALI